MRESTKSKKRLIKFSKTAIEDLPPAVTRRAVYYDETVPGLAVRVSPSGHRSFYYFYRSIGKGRSEPSKGIYLGSFPTMTVEQARLKARQKAALVVNGQDPAKELQEGKAVPTVVAAWDEFFAGHRVDLKPHTISHYEGLAQRYILPALGKMKIDAVTSQDLKKLHLAIGGVPAKEGETKDKPKPYAANRTLAVLSCFFNWCEGDRGYRTKHTNPTNGVKKYKEVERKGYFDDKQLEAIGQAIFTLEGKGLISRFSAAALRLLLLTGARKTEILSLKWSYLNLETGTARLPDSKTGFKVLHLSALAVEILQNLKTFNGEFEYVFPSNSKGGHLSDLRRPWVTVCKEAKLTGWRPHDMRHTFGSVAASSGQSLQMIGKQLGHKKASTTERYAHLASSPVHDMTEKTAAKIAEGWNKAPADAPTPPDADNPPADAIVH